MSESGKEAATAGHHREVTAFVEQLLENDEPIVIRINGKKEVAIQGKACRQLLLELVDRSESIENVQAALAAMKRGEPGIPLEQFIAEKKAKYDL